MLVNRLWLCVVGFCMMHNVVAAIPNCTLANKLFPISHNGLDLFLSRTTAAHCHNNYPQKLKYPDILLIHGLTYSSHEFNVKYRDYSLVRFLAERGARVWVLDMTGYGNSAKPQNGFVVDGAYAANDIAMAEDTIARVSKVEKINLLGWSFGAVASARMAQAHPTLINTLVLYAPLYYGKGNPAPTEDYHKFVESEVLSDFQKNATGEIDSTITESGLIKTYLKQCKKYDKNGSPNGGRKYDNQGTTVHLFEPNLLNMPVLILGGGRDPVINHAVDLPKIIQQLPNNGSKLIEYKGASHMIMLERPYYHQFQRDVWNFIRANN